MFFQWQTSARIWLLKEVTPKKGIDIILRNWSKTALWCYYLLPHPMLTWLPLGLGAVFGARWQQYCHEIHTVWPPVHLFCPQPGWIQDKNSSHCYLLLLKVHSWSLFMTQACLACYHLVGSYLLNSFQYNCWGLHRECAPGWRLGQDVWHCVKREVQVVSLTNDPSLLKGTCTEDSVHEWHKTAFALHTVRALCKKKTISSPIMFGRGCWIILIDLSSCF